MKCPDCDSELFAYEHNPASDHPELAEWFVECTQCQYVVDDSFRTEEDAKTFIDNHL